MCFLQKLPKSADRSATRRISIANVTSCVGVMTANSHIRVIRAGFLPVALGLPAAVAVDQLRQVGRLLGVSGDELVLQKFFGRRPLWTRSGQTDRADYFSS